MSDRTWLVTGASRGLGRALVETVPSTIDDASVLDTLRPVLQKGPGA